MLFCTLTADSNLCLAVIFENSPLVASCRSRSISCVTLICDMHLFVTHLSVLYRLLTAQIVTSSKEWKTSILQHYRGTDSRIPAHRSTAEVSPLVIPHWSYLTRKRGSVLWLTQGQCNNITLFWPDSLCPPSFNPLSPTHNN